MQASDSDVIFLRTGDGTLTRAPVAGYLTESELQALVAAHPELLGGDQIDESDPPRWLLVGREAGVPDGDDGSARWSIDHLFVDHRGVPTLVEVKRSSDTRIRREVVGQMLDYAANASSYWPADRIRTMATNRAGSIEALDRQVRELRKIDDATDDDSIEQFWSAVDENLRLGRIRLLFVADELPRELRRIIEFLNEHMPGIEVLGVELRRYAADGVEALVPRVIGQTERARAAHDRGATTRKTSEGAFLDALSPRVREFFSALLATARGEGLAVSWGTKGFSIRGLDSSGQPVSILYGYPPGALGREHARIEVYLKALGETDAASELRTALMAHPGFSASGQYTISVEVNPERVSGLLEQLSSVWVAYRGLRA